MMPDRSSSSNFNMAGHGRARGFRSGVEADGGAYGAYGAKRGNRFLVTQVRAEDFFLETVEGLRRQGLAALAESFQRKSIFLDLGILEGSTTFIIWLGCPEMYERFTDAEGGVQISKAADYAAKTLGLEYPVRTVMALFGAKTADQVL